MTFSTRTVSQSERNTKFSKKKKELMTHPHITLSNS